MSYKILLIIVIVFAEIINRANFIQINFIRISLSSVFNYCIYNTQLPQS